MNRRQSLEKGILSPPGPFLTPSQSPSIQHSPRLQPSPSQSPFQQQDVLIVTNNNQHYINTFTTQEQDRKTGTPNRRLSLNHISPNAGTIVYRPSPTQSPAGNEFNTTLVGSNNISLNKKGKRTPNTQYGTAASHVASSKATKKTAGGMTVIGNSPIASPSASPQPMIQQQFPMMNNSSIVFMQQPATSHRTSIIQTSNTQSNFLATSTNSGKQNKAPQQILPKPTSSNCSSASSSPSIVSISGGNSQSLISTTTSTKQILTQSKMAIVQQSQQFQSPPHHSQQQIISQPSSGSPSPQPQQLTQGGSIILPSSGQHPLLLNQMPLLVQQNTPQGVQLILRPQNNAPQLGTPGLVIHNRPQQMQQSQPQQLLRILNTNGSMQLATTSAPAFIVSSQGNIIQQNLQGIKTQNSNSNNNNNSSSGNNNNNNQMGNQHQGIQTSHRQPQQIITANSHILGQSVAQIQNLQNLQLNGNLTQIQMPNGQIIQQLPAQFSQNLGSFNQIQPLTAIANATFQSPPQNNNNNNNNSQNDIVSTGANSNPIQFHSQTMTAQGAQIISPVATPHPQIIQSSDPILSSPPSITFNHHSQPTSTTVYVSNDKQIHEISSPPPFSIIQQNSTEMINIDMSHHQQQQQPIVATKPARKPKKSKKKLALEQQQLLQQQQQQQQEQELAQIQQQQQIMANEAMLSPNRNNNQAPTGKLDLANVMKLCGIMEDDDFMDTDENEGFESQTMEQTQTIHIPANATHVTGTSSSGENNEITITIPGGTSSDQPFTFTIPSSSLEGSNAHGATIIQSDGDNKISENVPFMIRFDGDGQGASNQPFTISVPNLNDDLALGEDVTQKIVDSSAPGINCVPSFVNSVLNSSVTPTIQSQINEIQNQLMASVPTTPTKPAKAPRQKKQTTKRSKKQQEKTIEVPTQIGNIQISQIDGTTLKNHTIENKNINNQIQIMPILEKGPLMEKQKIHVPIMQQSISHQNQNHGGNNNQQQQQQGTHTGSSSSSSGPSQVNINVQQNQLINVTNNLQMQVIANPQQHHNATPAPAPPSSSNAHHHHHNATQSTQNIIGNIISGNHHHHHHQGGGGGNIIIQGTPTYSHQQQQPANIQVNIQNQTIANNIIHTTAPAQNHQQQPTAQSILSQLTGNLVLSLSEDGRLILRHDPNIPQDAQSQMILQTILTGALGNVSLINEPLKQQQQQQQQQQVTHQNHSNAQPTTTTTHHVIGANGKVQQVTTVQNNNKNVIITSQGQPVTQHQQIFNSIAVPSTQTIVTQSHPQQIQVNTNTGIQQKPQAVVLPTPNIIKFVELPKIQPNQQLFSLNTLTNEITLLNPNQTTAALSPMERLLIVPSGINAQQLAQCLSQGQIHFNNIGEAPTTDPNKVQMQMHVQQQQQQQQQQQVTMKTINMQQKSIQIKKEPVEVKPKKARGKKAKLLEEQQQQILLQKEQIKKEPIQSPPPMKILTSHSIDTKATIVKTTLNATSSSSITTTGTKNTITISPNPTMIVNPTKNNVIKNTAITATKVNKNSISVIPTSTLLPNINNNNNINNNTINNINNSVISTSTTTKVITTTAVTKSNCNMNNNKKSQQTPPPLVSMNQASVPRVQTIQLTPQKQQSLKNVQMQIQQLSGKLQNKSLLATLTADLDVNSAAFNRPLPVLTNIMIHSMTDGEIYEALQRLFVEQQKILATGKIIQTIPAAVSPSGNQQTIRTLPNSQSIYVNQSIVAPISSSSSGSTSTLYGGGNLQKVPSPIQVNSPILKQESQLSSASTSSSQPPPLVVSTPIQMQIKTEILPSQNTPPVSTHISNPPPATGSIIISPKYTTPAKITIDPHSKEQKVTTPIESKVEIVPIVNEVDTAALLKKQQAEALQKIKVARSSLFERQICVDQEGCTKPDVKADFSSKEDAIKRLIRYHCMHEEIKDENDPKESYEIEEKSKLILASFQAMKEKFQHLLIKQSQQHAPTSELMMLDRLQVADLKDEIVSMQTDLNSVLYENQQQQQQQQGTQEVTPTIKTEPISQPTTKNNNQAPVNSSQQRQQFLPSMQEPSQILKAKQEQKLFESIKNERIKVENAEKEVRKPAPSPSPQQMPIPTKAMSKFDKLKNDCNPQQQQQQSSPGKQQPSTMKLISELKDELDDFDIESEIRSNFIMKKCEPTISSPALPALLSSPSTGSSSKKTKTREREFSPFSDYLNSVKMDLVPSKTGNKNSEGVKNEDGTYDEWLSIQKELSLDLDSKRKENVDEKKTTKALESDLSDIFDHSSPKSVEKQLDDLFSSASGTAASPPELNELFNESSTINEKTVENRLEALFGHEDQMKSSQQDLVETRLEQLFQGSVNSNDESALDSASFLYKNPDLTYEMIQKQVSATASVTAVNNNANAAASTSNKRQWTSNNSCDIFSSANSSIVFPSSSSPTSSKRACTTQSVAFDENKWIDDSFDFESDINIPTETSNDGLKHREWNGGMDHNNDTIMGNQQFQANIQQQAQIPMNSMISEMDTSQIPPLNYEDDVDDISRQVQNAIDSILNLQSSDPLHYQLDSSFLELNAITSSSPNSPVSHVQHHPQNIQSNQYPSIPQAHQFAIQNSKMMTNSTAGSGSGITKQAQQHRKFSRVEDIGDCLIGGSNLDDSPSALSLTLTDSHGDASSASVGEFVNNLLNCDEKSISTS